MYLQGQVNAPDRPDACLVPGDYCPLGGRNIGEVSPDGSPGTIKGRDANTLHGEKRASQSLESHG